MNNTSQSSLAALLRPWQIAACGDGPTRRSTDNYIDDSATTTKVEAALVRDNFVNGTAVKVHTFKGNVQLSGFAESTDEIHRAVRIARQVPGVKLVRNNIVVNRRRNEGGLFP